MHAGACLAIFRTWARERSLLWEMTIDFPNVVSEAQNLILQNMAHHTFEQSVHGQVLLSTRRQGRLMMMLHLSRQIATA
jgi:hypothetical protein